MLLEQIFAATCSFYDDNSSTGLTSLALTLHLGSKRNQVLVFAFTEVASAKAAFATALPVQAEHQLLSFGSSKQRRTMHNKMQLQA